MAVSAFDSINDDQVNKILENDIKYECDVPEDLSDIVIFKKGGNVVHSARRNKNSKYDNNAGILTTEYNVSLAAAARGLTDVNNSDNTLFARRRADERSLNVKYGTVDANGVRTITDPDEIKAFLNSLKK